MKILAAILLAVAIAFLLAFLLGFVVIPWLRKLKFGQTILDIGPAWHFFNDAATTEIYTILFVGTCAPTAPRATW